jgi:hypothetical protein
MLFVLFGSAASLWTDALLIRIVPFGVSDFTLTITVTLAPAPFANVPKLHLRGCDGSPGTVVPLHDPTLGVALMTLTCTGRNSSTTTFGAGDGLCSAA